MRRAGFLALVLLCAASRAHASSATCSFEDVAKYGYGEKASLRVVVPDARHAEFVAAVEAYANRNHMNYGSAGMSEPEKVPVVEKLTQIMDSPSYDTTIYVRTTNLKQSAHVTVWTFSNHCTATEDWRPWWRDFKAFLKSEHYRVSR